MKRYMSLIIFIIYICMSIIPVSIYATESQDEEKKEKKYIPHAEHILVCDTNARFEVYSKNCNKEFNPYGFTKILTVITALEYADNIDMIVTVPDTILKDYDYSQGNIWLSPGEKVSIRDLASAAIMQDAGDCALALAHTVGSSYDDFISHMNDTAKKAGAENSVFTEPVGVSSKQKTTLWDMAKICSYALNNEDFAKIAKIARLAISATNKVNAERVIFSTNKFLTKFYSEDYYDTRVSGIKGYYKDAANTGLITRYQYGSDDILVLIAKSDADEDANINYAYEDTVTVVKKAENYFINTQIIEKEEFVTEIPLNNAKGTDRALIVSLSDINARLPKDYESKLIKREIILKDNIEAPLKKFEEIGEVKLYYDKVYIGSAKLASYSAIDNSTAKEIVNSIVSFITSLYFILTVILIITIIYLIVKKRKKVQNP